jgi:hypothetical protein
MHCSFINKFKGYLKHSQQRLGLLHILKHGLTVPTAVGVRLRGLIGEERVSIARQNDINLFTNLQTVNI